MLSLLYTILWRVLTQADVPGFTETFEIESNFTEIGASCFWYSKSTLKNFTFQPNPLLEVIGVVAFEGCYCLEYINLSQCTNLKRIGISAFDSCYSVKYIVLPQNLEVIYTDPFGSCGLVESIDLPKGLKKIGDSGFSGLRKIYKIDLPSSVFLSVKMLFIIATI